MFESIHRDSIANHGTQYSSLATSIVAHSALAFVFVFSQLFLFKGIPGNEIATFLVRAPETFTSLVPSPPPATRTEARESPVTEENAAYQTNVPKEEMEMPSKIPSILPPPTDDPAFLRTALNIGGIPGPYGTPGTGFIPGTGLVPSLVHVPLPELKTPESPPEVKSPVRIGVLNPSKLIFQVPPRYPILAHKLHVSGTVILEALIDEEGVVSRVEIVEGHPLLRDSAAEAVKQWKYSPTIQNGEPIPIIATVKIVYKIDR